MDGVVYAEPDHVVRQTAVPNDPLLSYEWDMSAIRAPEAWDVTTGSPQVTVAVVDTGIDASHPDLSPNLWTNPGESGAGRDTNGLDDDGDGLIDDVHGWDFVDGDAQPDDGNGHGTHVSGTIAARGDDGVGVAGVTWSTAIMPLRVLGDDGSGYVSDVVTAYAYAASSGARLVNASLGGGSYSRAEHDAIAAAPNTLFVVAAGNDGADDDATPEYPCDYDLANVVCVAASDRDDTLASFSNYGTTNVDLAAPGVDIASTWPGGRYALLDGTSMATPHVTGAAALVLAHDGTLGVAGLRAALLSSVHPVAALAGRVATGGRLDVAAALSVAPARRPAPAAGGQRARRRRARRSRRPRPTARPPGRLAAHRSRHAAHRPRPRPAPRPRRVGGRPRKHRRPHRRTQRPSPAPVLAHDRTRDHPPRRRGAQDRSPYASRRARRAPCARPRACASSPTRSRSTPRAIAVGPSARQRCGAERPRAAGRLANVLPFSRTPPIRYT